MANCDSCPSKGKCSSDKESCMIENNPKSNVKNIIAVMSGKGGVGKSSITGALASEVKARGFSVGILDADITGPSIPRIFGLNGENAYANEEGIIPLTTATGIKVMSMNFLTEYEEQAVIWRGPLIAGAVKQFWTDVVWGDLDYLFVDMPPGTGDVPLTVMQVMPVTGVVMVSTPQNMVSMIVAKAVNMTEKMNKKVIGVIENMSYIECKNCGEKTYIFGESSAEKAAEKVGADLLGELPLDTEMAELSEEGKIELYVKINDRFKKITDNVLEKIK